jgi:hypothetical protein
MPNALQGRIGRVHRQVECPAKMDRQGVGLPVLTVKHARQKNVKKKLRLCGLYGPSSIFNGLLAKSESIVRVMRNEQMEPTREGTGEMAISFQRRIQRHFFAACIVEYAPITASRTIKEREARRLWKNKNTLDLSQV